MVCTVKLINSSKAKGLKFTQIVELMMKLSLLAGETHPSTSTFSSFNTE